MKKARKGKSKKRRSSGGGKFKPMDALFPALAGVGAYLGGLYVTRMLTKDKGIKDTGVIALLPAAAVGVAGAMLMKDKLLASSVLGSAAVLGYNVASTIGFIGKDEKNPINASLVFAGDEDYIDITPDTARELIEATAMSGAPYAMSGVSNDDPLSGSYTVSGPSNDDPLQ